MPRARSILPLLILFLTVLCGAGCKGEGKRQFEASRAINHTLNAAETRLLDLRFGAGALRIEQTDLPQIMIAGTIRVRTTDNDAAQLRAGALDVEITAGRFTMLTLPEAPAGFEYEIDFTLTVPRNLNLRVVLGSGSVAGNFALPMMTDLQVGSGNIELRLPKNTSAFIHAESNVSEELAIEGFERLTGQPVRQLTHVEFNGSVGLPMTLVGSRVEARVNAGRIAIRGK